MGSYSRNGDWGEKTVCATELRVADPRKSHSNSGAQAPEIRGRNTDLLGVVWNQTHRLKAGFDIRSRVCPTVPQETGLDLQSRESEKS